MIDAPRAIWERELIAAHSMGDPGKLADLYLAVAAEEETAGRTGAARFFLTQAYVCALEAGRLDEAEIAGRLRSYNCEPPV